MKKGYKAFDKRLKAEGYQYEIGQTYKFNGKLELYVGGFHFCKEISDCARYYDVSISKYAEVEAIGAVIEGNDNCVTDEIKIVRLISNSELYELINSGKNNIGAWNSGDNNTGDWNTGDLNIGSCNSGDRNTGNRNVGHENVGDRNIGNGNTGNDNRGSWNKIDGSTGFFCTEPQTVKIFDIDTGETYEKFVKRLPGFLWYMPFGYHWEKGEIKEYTVEDRQKFYNELKPEYKKQILDMPNFNAYKFEQCTGIKV